MNTKFAEIWLDQAGKQAKFSNETLSMLDRFKSALREAAAEITSGVDYQLKIVNQKFGQQIKEIQDSVPKLKKADKTNDLGFFTSYLDQVAAAKTKMAKTAADYVETVNKMNVPQATKDKAKEQQEKINEDNERLQQQSVDTAISILDKGYQLEADTTKVS